MLGPHKKVEEDALSSNALKKKIKLYFKQFQNYLSTCATLISWEGTRQPLPLTHTPLLTLCSLALVLLSNTATFELFPLCQPSTGQGSAWAPFRRLPAPPGSTALLPPGRSTAEPMILQFHSRLFTSRKEAGRAAPAAVLMWLFLEMSPEQN